MTADADAGLHQPPHERIRLASDALTEFRIRSGVWLAGVQAHAVKATHTRTISSGALGPNEKARKIDR